MVFGMANQLNDLRSYSRHWLGEFIELYQAEECLWQPKHPDYSNNLARNTAYDKLVEKLKEVEPNPDRNMVVRKINSLRSAFRRELRKINARPNYETRLWYYNKLVFIADHGNPKRLISAVGGVGSGGSINEFKPKKRCLALGFDDDDSMDFDNDQQLEASSVHSAQAVLQAEAALTAAVTGTGEVVTIVKSENGKEQQQHHQQQQQQQHLHQQQHHQHHESQESPSNGGDDTVSLHHHQQQQQQQQHHQQQHEASPSHQQHQQQHHHAQTQHTTAVKVLEITSLDTNSQRELQQAVNTLEQQQHLHQQLQQQHHHHHHQQAGQTTTAQLTQLHQQVPTIQIAREHLQPLFGGTATAYTTTATAASTPLSNQRTEDEYDAIGVNVACKLRVMTTHQRIIAEKLISDVLFNGQLDNLSVNSHLA